MSYYSILYALALTASVILMQFGPYKYSVLEDQYNNLISKVEKRQKVQDEYYTMLELIDASNLWIEDNKQSNEGAEEAMLLYLSQYFEGNPKIILEDEST